MTNEVTGERLPSFEELHTRAEERLEYWVQGAVLEFTEELTDLMETCHVNRTELAKRTRVTPAYITKVLSGEGNFTLSTMTKLARAMDREVRVHLAPLDTVTDSRDLSLPYARAIRWTPAGGPPSESDERRVRQRLAELEMPKRQVDSSGSERHGHLSLAA